MIRVCIITLFLFFSCKQKTKIPDNVLPPGKMEKVLLDMLRADEFLNQKKSDTSIPPDSFNRTVVYNSVFLAHKINQEKFRKSFSYYESHPDMLKIVLDSMNSEVRKTHVHSDTLKKPDLKSKMLQKNKRALSK